MSNPSPEPSAESLAEARELLRMSSRDDPGTHVVVSFEATAARIALLADAAKRSSRREALGQAAAATCPYCAGLWEKLRFAKVPTRDRKGLLVHLKADDEDGYGADCQAPRVRALMEAE